jgi:hypothetical protein
LIKDEFEEKKFQRSDTAERAFKTLKAAFISAPILGHFDARFSMVIETDMSDCVIRAILSQVENSFLKPLAFHSRKMDKAEIDYEIYNKEKLGFISAFKK